MRLDKIKDDIYNKLFVNKYFIIMELSLSNLDIAIAIATMIAIIVYAIYPSRERFNDSTFWVNGRKTPAFLLAASLSSSVVGAGTLFAVVQMGYKGGMAGAVLGLANASGVILFGLLAAPKINELGRKKNWVSIGDPIRERYNDKTVRLVGIINLIAFFFFAAAQFSALSVIVSWLSGWSQFTSLFISTAILLLYTSVGGLRADIRSDFLQLFFMLFSASFLFLSLMKLNQQPVFALIDALPAGYLTGTAYAGSTFLIATMILLPPSVFVSLDMWQRALAADSPQTAKKSFVSGGVIMALFFVIFSIIGTVVYINNPDLQSENVLLFALQTIKLPLVGGIALGGLFAALLSTADSMIVAASVAIANDISKKRFLSKPHAVALVVGILSAITAFLIPDIVDLLINAFSSLLLITPLFIGILWWRRPTAFSASLSLTLGLLTLLAFIFIDPTTAFLPAFVVSLLSFIIITLMKK